MSIWILRLAALVYAGAVGAYVLQFAKPRTRGAASVGQVLLTVAFALHAASIGFACSEFGGAEFFTLRGGLVMAAWLAAGGLLVLLRFYHLPPVATFITPLILLALLPTLFGGPGRLEVVPEVVRLPALKVHVSSALAGIAFFAIAFGVALMYLLQEREVKGKRFGALFSRLPSLESLDRLNQRLVRAGFVVYTVALITGSLVAKKAWGSAFSWDAQQVVSLGIWLLYGAMVHLRHVGIHGRRYAMLTLAGFALVLTTMVALKQAPGLTKHRGTYEAKNTQGGAS
jgi:ABC-type transport system involved in cytochrome c biogenesis permease subunit